MFVDILSSTSMERNFWWKFWSALYILCNFEYEASFSIESISNRISIIEMVIEF